MASGQACGCERVLVSGHIPFQAASANTADAPPCVWVTDRWAGLGPIGGLASVSAYEVERQAGLAMTDCSQTGHWLIVPIDMPYLSAAYLHTLQQALLSQLSPIAHFSDHCLPLALNWSPAVHRALQAFIQPNYPPRLRSVRRFVAHIGAGAETIIPAPYASNPHHDTMAKQIPVHMNALSNINTPKEWQCVLAHSGDYDTINPTDNPTDNSIDNPPEHCLTHTE